MNIPDFVQNVTFEYFEDTDTLHIELRPGAVAETRDLDENTLLDLDRDGNICSLTIENFKKRAKKPDQP